MRAKAIIAGLAALIKLAKLVNDGERARQTASILYNHPWTTLILVWSASCSLAMPSWRLPLFLNLVFLLFIVLMPFVASLLGQFGYLPIAVIIYGLTEF